MLTGDFLAPYLLSAIDKGVGMMTMLNKIPIDYVIWGNHEHDMAHADVMKREREYQGVWINTNMQSHESFKNSTCQVDSVILDIRSQDGSNERKLGMIGLLSSQPSLYKPGAFGGAVIEDPWQTMEDYNRKLKDAGCDMVLPLCHLYVPQDHRTCRQFDFPVILSGHDHHRVDEVIEGTRLLKPGMDAKHAVILDLTWESSASDPTPTIFAETLVVGDFAADPALQVEVAKAYSMLDPLTKTELTTVPDRYLPLSSEGAREGLVSMATFLLSQLRVALNMDSANYPDHCDCVIVKVGVRGERSYHTNKFSLETLRSEFPRDKTVHVFEVPGEVLRTGLRESWKKPGNGWMQHCDGVKVDGDGLVISIGGKLLDPKRVYRVGSYHEFSNDSGVDLDPESPSIYRHFQDHPEGLPDLEAGIGCHTLLLTLFSRDVWCRLWRALDADGEHCLVS